MYLFKQGACRTSITERAKREATYFYIPFTPVVICCAADPGDKNLLPITVECKNLCTVFITVSDNLGTKSPQGQFNISIEKNNLILISSSTKLIEVIVSIID